MITIKIEIETVGQLESYLRKNSWAGAQDRVKDMTYEEVERIFDYIEESELTETELNDFIWFDWDDVKQNMED